MNSCTGQKKKTGLRNEGERVDGQSSESDGERAELTGFLRVSSRVSFHALNGGGRKEMRSR